MFARPATVRQALRILLHFAWGRAAPLWDNGSTTGDLRVRNLVVP